MDFEMSTAQGQGYHIQRRQWIVGPYRPPVKFEFPLTELNAELLEKVINKMDPRSYFRLQRTCRDLNAFIRKSKNISVYMNAYYMVPFCFPPGREEVIIVDGDNVIDNVIDPEGLFGIRLENLYVNRWNPFDKVCDVLKKYRITCNTVELSYFDLTKKQVQTVLDITKPTEFSVPISYTYELLLRSKILKNVGISLEMDVVVDAMTKFLTKFSKIKLRLVYDTPVQLPFLRTILKVLLSECRPQLRYFKFCPVWQLANIPSEEEIKQLFYGFSLKPVTHNYKKNVFEVELPQYFPPKASCQINMGEYKTSEIVYKSGPDVRE